MKLKYMFESVDMGDEIIAVPVGDFSSHVNGILKMNKEGQEILELLKEDISEDSIIRILGNKYTNDVTTIGAYVHEVIESLRCNGLLEE